MEKNQKLNNNKVDLKLYAQKNLKITILQANLNNVTPL